VDPIANRWRWATLQLVQGRIQRQGGHEDLRALYDKNIQGIVKLILDMLRKAALHSNGEAFVPEGIVKEVSSLVELAGHLALDMGVQRAQLIVVWQPWGDIIRVGEELNPARDEKQQAPGQELAVDMMLCPALLRVGDGREDLSTVKVIHAGEAYFQ
jgi:hypothetical protein